MTRIGLSIRRWALALMLAAILLPAPSLAASPAQQGALSEAGTAGTGAVAAGTLWDSGWQPLAAGACQVFTHNVGGNPDDYAVELWFHNPALGINRRGYGGLDVDGSPQGAHWEMLTASAITVCRGADDPAAQQVRVRVSVAGPPDYASAWTPINPGQTLVFPHNLNLPALDLTVGLWFRSAARGIHNLGYGGLAVDTQQEMRGAHWQNLTATEVQVIRHPDDPDVEEVRVVVVAADPPDFDSGVRPLALGTNLIAHGLNWNPALFLARGECVSTDRGIHQLFAGGNDDWTTGRQGVHLQNLQRNEVTVVRWPNDTVCPEGRVRIWRRVIRVYLPLVVR